MSNLPRVAPRARPSPAVRTLVPFVSLGAAGVVGAVVIALSGAGPLTAYETMFDASLNGWRPITRTLTLATPLILTGLAAAVAFRMRVWNIGAEGQLYAGAIAASALAVGMPDDSPRVLIVGLVLVAGAVAGAGWAALAAIPRAYLNTNEVITTLMLNFVALYFMNYLIFGSVSFWRNPDAMFPQGKLIPESAELGVISYRLHYGLVIAVAVAIVLWWALRGTTWGFEVRTIGDSPVASRYAGMSVAAKVVSVLCLSGALAGLAGAIEVSGVLKTLDPRALATEMGFTGIVVAAVARLNPLGVIPVAVLLGAIANSGTSLQTVGVQAEIVFLLQGLVFLFVASGEFLLANRLVFTTPEGSTAGDEAVAPATQDPGTPGVES